MIRAAIAAGTAVIVAGAAAGTGAAMHDTGAVLDPIVSPQTGGVSIDDAPEHTAVVHAPSSTALLAVASGALSVVTPARVILRGSGDDAGLEVEYTGLGDNVPDGPVQRGGVVGHVLDAARTVSVRAVLDAKPLDTGALLRAALDGISRSDGAWTKPVDGAAMSQGYGCVPYAFEPPDHACPSGHLHTGIDLAAPMGTPVHAALDGTSHVIASTTGYGLHVLLDSGGGLTTLYAHLQSVDVHDGDEVSAGDLIGEVGSSGNSTGPHLHFEVRRDGIPEDPTLDVALP
jgi:hypothetical protein